MANDKMLHTKAEVLRENIKVEEGIIESIVGSTSVLDRMGDVIDQAGWDIKNFLKNPVILWGHNVKEERPPIGRAVRVWKGGASKKSLMFSVKFDLQDSFAAEIFRKIKDGFINTVSVGFIPLEWEDLDKKTMGRRYTKQELLELSFVPVPANPEAVIALRGMGKSDERFAPVELDKLYPQADDSIFKEEVEEETSVVEEPSKTNEIPNIPPVETTPPSPEVTPTEEGIDIPPVQEEVKVEESKVEPEIETVNEEEVKDTIADSNLSDIPSLGDEKIEEPKVETENIENVPAEEEKETEIEGEDKAMLNKGIIDFSDYGIAPETEDWDAAGEEAKCNVADLKIVSTWFDLENVENKNAYKLLHHKGDGDHKAVWRGVVTAMASLLGARGGVQIPEVDREGVYNHLKKHYAQFDKPAPDFKMVKDQVLAGLTEELQVLALEREDRYQVRLIKKVLQNQKAGYSSGQVKEALVLINLALSHYKNSKKGGE